MLDVTVGSGNNDAKNEVYGTNEDRCAYQFIWEPGYYASSGTLTSSTHDAGEGYHANWSTISMDGYNADRDSAEISDSNQ
jgi:hypothetical protein